MPKAALEAPVADVPLPIAMLLVPRAVAVSLFATVPVASPRAAKPIATLRSRLFCPTARRLAEGVRLGSDGLQAPTHSIGRL